MMMMTKKSTKWVMILDQKTLFANRNAMGMMENNDMARVMMPMVIPPVRRVTQKQQRFRHGILTLFQLNWRQNLFTTRAKCSPNNFIQRESAPLVSQWMNFFPLWDIQLEFCQRIVCIQNRNVEPLHRSDVKPHPHTLPYPPCLPTHTQAR